MKRNMVCGFDVNNLVFQCENIAEHLRMNFGSLPADSTLPVTLLGSGYYGKAYRLNNWPGLVLKVCTDDTDGYPAYIRAIVKLGAKIKSWMPEIYASGGDETDRRGMFWCVMPEYINPAGVGAGYSTFSTSWADAGGVVLSDALNDGGKEKREVPAWDEYGFEYITKTRRTLTHLDKKTRRLVRSFNKFLKPMRAAGAEVYMHEGNALKNTDGSWVITDPIASWYGKQDYERAHQ